MADYLASLGWTPVVLCSTAWLRLTGVNSHVKCHFHSNTYFRLDRTDAQFVDIIHTAGYWVYFDQCIIFFHDFLTFYPRLEHPLPVVMWTSGPMEARRLNLDAKKGKIFLTID